MKTENRNREIAKRNRELALRFVYAGAALCAAWPISHSAQARWKPEYASVSPEIRAWYERQETTPEFRERVGKAWYMKCCDHSDVVDAEFSKDKGKWQYRVPGEVAWHALPDDVVQPDVMTPGSKPVLFVDATGSNIGPVCFFPGGTGA